MSFYQSFKENQISSKRNHVHLFSYPTAKVKSQKKFQRHAGASRVKYPQIAVRIRNSNIITTIIDIHATSIDF